MKKKSLLWTGLLLSSLAWLAIGNNLQLLVNFLIAGSVPYTHTFIGLGPTLLLVIGLVWVMRRLGRSLHFQMIKHAAQLVRAEQGLSQAGNSQPQTKQKISAVIAAPSLSTADSF